MKLTILGTGDSPGTPVIGCHCRTCEHARKNGWERLRFSILLQNNGKSVLIDTSPDMRKQLLNVGVDRVDAVIWTHSHYDHFAGFGDFYRVQSGVNVLSSAEVLEDVGRFMYFMKYRERQVEVYEPIKIFGMELILIDVNHPPMRRSHGVVVNFRGKKIVITGDTNSEISQRSIDEMMNPDLLIVDAIAPEGYRLRKHMNAGDAFSLSKKLNARKTLFIHVGHFYQPNSKYPIARDFQSFHFHENLALDSFL